MKKVIIALSIAIFCFSCTKEECEVKTAGFVTDFPDATYTIGSDESVSVWQKYIDLHNQKDLD